MHEVVIPVAESFQAARWCEWPTGQALASSFTCWCLVKEVHQPCSQCTLQWGSSAAGDQDLVME